MRERTQADAPAGVWRDEAAERPVISPDDVGARVRGDLRGTEVAENGEGAIEVRLIVGLVSVGLVKEKECLAKKPCENKKALFPKR